MNDQLSKLLKTMQEIAAHAEYPSISIIMPTARTMPDKLQDHIRLKDLIAQATDKALKDFEKRDLEQLFARLDSLVASYDFSKSLHGLALFVNKSYGIILPLPFSAKAHVSVGQQFHIDDLLQTLYRMKHYWLLELHKDMSRLYEAYNDELHEVVTPLVDQSGNPVQGFPLDYVLPEDKKRVAEGSGDLQARYPDDQLKHYFSMVDHELGKILQNKPLPVVVIGDEKNISTFKHLTKHGSAIIGYQHGDYSRRQHELGQAALPIFNTLHEKETKAVLQQFTAAEGTLKQAFGVHRVWLMAHEGRIAILLVEEGLVIPGKLDSENPDHLYIYEKNSPDFLEKTLKPFVYADFSPDVRNLVDVIIERVIKTDGKIVFVKPGALEDFEHIGAILRY
jgi:hypothetical protein